MAAVLVLIFLVTPCALVGGCNVAMGLNDLSSKNNVAFALLFGIPTILLTVGFFIWSLKLWRG